MIPIFVILAALVVYKEVTYEPSFRHNIDTNITNNCSIEHFPLYATEIPVYLFDYIQEDAKTNADLRSLAYSIRSSEKEQVKTTPTFQTSGYVDTGVYGIVTHFGLEYQDKQMGCPGSGLYDSNNPTIVAVSPSHYVDIPCDTPLTICGPAGCIQAVRSDSCPGCSENMYDLSEVGILAVCGDYGPCEVSIKD